ncbi:MAG: 1,4-dihydroxy-2-naphthoate polyprenyltransferase, partial [Flavobacteriaceae bacterium]|nr:1,4-dihydroxy-2-naphthoate polyprenyltransferase [Flavobacteriaceae bacterium]
MQQFKIWLSAARLRTLSLSISGILVGNALCLNQPNFSWVLFVLMLFIAISFQIISNFANDYGDGIKGTDNENRVGPKRVLQQGLL